MSLSFEQKLDNYAQIAVHIGAGLQAGQRLLLMSPIECASLARLIVAEAYRAGAPLVEVIWGDDAVQLARYQHAPADSFAEMSEWPLAMLMEYAERGDAVISIRSTDPDLLRDQNPEHIQTLQMAMLQQRQPYSKKVMSNAFNWSLLAAPLPSWSQKVFPDLPAAEAETAMWDVIFKVVRADQPNPITAWEQHLAHLTERKTALNAKQYDALHFRAPGTDLRIGLPKNHIWGGGRDYTKNARKVAFTANVPTEEVWTLPHRERVDGHVCSTKPLSYSGTVIDNITIRFEQGRVVEAHAEQGNTTLQQLINTDEGARYLGEVALVANSSPIAQSGVLFYHTLFDENAACHIAIGNAYRFNLENGSDLSPEAFTAAGGNTSITHVDWMIGSAAMDVDGILADGSVEPLMRAGEWV